jgi:tetratricopeptide (TPR) repeat protein
MAADIALRTNRPQLAIKIIEDAANPHFNPGNNFERQPVALKAKALYQTGQYDAAVRLIGEVPFRHRDGSFHRIMVKSLIHTAPPDEVAAYVEGIRLNDPAEWGRSGNGSFYNQLAASEYVLLDRREEARRFARLAEDSLNEGARAYSYLLTGRHREAEQLYEELVQRDPVNAVYMARIGALKAELGDAAEAMQCVDKILTKAEASAGEAHYLSATVFAQMGKFEQAMEHLHRAYAAGYRFTDTNYGNDPLLDTMKSYQPFAEFVRPRE